MQKKTILIIFGGCSTEYYVSCKSASGILEYIDKDLFEVVLVGVTLSGEWLLTEATSEEIQDGITWLDNRNNMNAIISPNRNKNELLVLNENVMEAIHIDCVFSVIHGHGGEDGSIQGLLEMSNIPYIGSNIAASANAMDKELTRVFADKCGLKQPACAVLHRKEYFQNHTSIKSLIEKNFKYPIFVKPASLGSSVGISKVEKNSQLENAIRTAFKYEDKILLEEGIVGREIKVAIIGNENLQTGEICELKVPGNAINDYATKYVKCSSIKEIPADISTELEESAKKQAIAIYKELNCKGFARVDFFLKDNKELFFNEINTVPGISKNSIFTLMFEKKGISYTDIITKLIDLAFEKTNQVAEINQKSFEGLY